MTTNAQRQAAFAERQRQAGKRRVAYWVDQEQEEAIKRLLETGSGLDKATVDMIVGLEREAERWKAEAVRLREALDPAGR